MSPFRRGGWWTRGVEEIERALLEVGRSGEELEESWKEVGAICEFCSGFLVRRVRGLEAEHPISLSLSLCTDTQREKDKRPFGLVCVSFVS